MTSAAIRAHDQPRVIEFLVIVSIINKTVAMEILGRPKRGASSTCSTSTSIPGIQPRDIAFDLSL